MLNFLKFFPIVIALGLIGCQGGNEAADPAPGVAAETADTKPVPAATGASPGKPSAPIIIDYEIVGSPIVGAPLQINVEVSSSEGPVTVHYNITDKSALMFKPGQVERWEIADPKADNVQQLAVIPQREGRLYVNVSAEVMTPGGSMIRSMSIPIKVGSAPARATINGELKEGPDGETVISMPAQESSDEPR